MTYGLVPFSIITGVVCAFVVLQPDLGTALLVAVSGGFALFLAGLQWRIILGMIVLAAAAAPALWLVMH